MSIPARYVHTNLIAEDWRSLARFYQEVFGCVPVPPERDFQGEKLDAGTGLSGAHMRGVHLRLPGYGETGPTLEILNYAALVRSRRGPPSTAPDSGISPSQWTISRQPGSRWLPQAAARLGRSSRYRSQQAHR